MNRMIKNIFGLIVGLYVITYVILELSSSFLKSPLPMGRRVPFFIFVTCIGLFVGNIRNIILGQKVSKKLWVISFILMIIGIVGIVIFP